LVAEATTLRRHLEADHSIAYYRWAEKANFISALPSDRKKAKAAAAASLPSPQTTLDDHLTSIPTTERVIPYSDAAFREAAIEWLVSTDQPIDALNNEKFKNMIDIASRAKDGVKIPGRKSIRVEILNLFKTRMKNLKAKLNVRVLKFPDNYLQRCERARR
ncbi:hypothetical protein C8R46DRAFT_923455, partial [Mycena filopes]